MLLNSEFEREYIRVRERYENTSPEAMAGLLTDNQMERLNKDILYVNFDMLDESGVHQFGRGSDRSKVMGRCI